MSLLFETIRLLDGEFMNLEYHNYRLNESRNTLFNARNTLHLENILKAPVGFTNGEVKCKVSYDLSVENIQFELYRRRSLHSLRIVHDNVITYNHKFSDRSALDFLFSARGGCDDLLIVKNGLITDTSFSNVVLYNGREWITPHEPLLKGTMRRWLLDQNIISEGVIKLTDLYQFEKVRLINSMLPFDKGIDILVGDIFE